MARKSTSIEKLAGGETMQRRPYSSYILALGGVILMGLGLYFVFFRPPLLPEDPRYMGTSLAAIQSTIPGLLVWLQHVFWVMGGFMFTSGLLISYVALTTFRARTPGAASVVAIAGLTSIAWMAVVNFIIASDFRWLLLSFVLPWIAALALYRIEKRKP
jgi:hypothetical protein